MGEIHAFVIYDMIFRRAGDTKPLDAAQTSKPDSILRFPSQSTCDVSLRSLGGRRRHHHHLRGDQHQDAGEGWGHSIESSPPDFVPVRARTDNDQNAHNKTAGNTRNMLSLVVARRPVWLGYIRQRQVGAYLHKKWAK